MQKGWIQLHHDVLNQGCQFSSRQQLLSALAYHLFGDMPACGPSCCSSTHTGRCAQDETETVVLQSSNAESMQMG